MTVVRRPESVRVKGFAARPGVLRPWAAAALSVVSLGLAGDPARDAGCARCGAPAALPVSTVRPKPTFVRRQERRPLRMSLRREGMMVANYTVCVRTCDGAFFPVSYIGAPSDALEQACRLLCPHADVALYSFAFGGTIDQAVSPTGESYSHLPNAGKFQQTYDPACSCRAPGQSWAEALAPAEAKYGRHSQDIVVSAEAAERMSRPVQDPKATPTAADPGQTLDINGVDTSLSAATAKMSRESADIHDEDGQRATSYGLLAGQTVEDTAPDGSIRRVRILPSTF
jgi:Protein of unknown function (DUF2865)